MSTLQQSKGLERLGSNLKPCLYLTSCPATRSKPGTMHTHALRSYSYAARLPPSLTPSLPPAWWSTSSRPASDRDPDPNFSGLAGALAERASAAVDPSPAAKMGALNALAPMAAVRAGGHAASGSPLLQALSAGAWLGELCGAGPSRACARAWPEPAAQFAESLAAGGAGVHPGGSDGMLRGARTDRIASDAARGPVYCTAAVKSLPGQLQCSHAQLQDTSTAYARVTDDWHPKTMADTACMCMAAWGAPDIRGVGACDAGLWQQPIWRWVLLLVLAICLCTHRNQALATALDRPLCSKCLCLTANAEVLSCT